MKNPILFICLFFALISCNPRMPATSENISAEPTKAAYAIIIHGGAGYTSKDISEEQKQIYYKMLESAIAVGEEVLKSGGSSLDAVEKTIAFMALFIFLINTFKTCRCINSNLLKLITNYYSTEQFIICY